MLYPLAGCSVGWGERRMSAAEDEKLGKYLITGTLGRGAMGTVYDAHDPVIDRRVAIKTIALAAAEDLEGTEGLARFKREAQAAGRLHHPNIVGVYDYGETDKVAYIVMEFVDGTSLKALLDAKERFTPAECVRIMEGVLAGLQYSHARGVVHRDIKPANIMLTSEGVVKIADFGIARIESSSLTQAGTIMGTPAYMSPEQFMGLTVDLRTDIYSSGVLLYQMLTGERPFDGSMTAIMHKVLNTEPPRPSDISVTSPLGLDGVVATAMAKRPERRFASAAAFAAALKTALETMPADAEATMVASPGKRLPEQATKGSVAGTEPARARRRAPLFIGAGLAGLALAGAAGFVFLRQGPAAVQAPPAKVVMPPPALQQAPPVAAPAPVAVAPSRDSLRAAVLAKITNAECALVSGDINGNGAVRLDGLVSSQKETALRSSLTQAVSPAPVDWNLASFQGPYCGVLGVLNPYAEHWGGGGLTLGLKDNPARLKNNDFVIPRVRMPGFAAYLTLDYFSSDGELLHIYPRKGDTQNGYAAEATAIFGDPKGGGFTFPVAKPFGTDIIVAIASERPLFSKPRPNSDTVAAYLVALHQALAAAGNVNATAMVVHTTP
jgi:predicted Ser/Thr protein kinase